MAGDIADALAAKRGKGVRDGTSRNSNSKPALAPGAPFDPTVLLGLSERTALHFSAER
jgi:hypothetical protein